MSSRPSAAALQHLADDLAWLEQHCHAQPELHVHAAAVRFAASLVRNVVAPYLAGQRGLPLHVAVVGGAGAGKSTVVNLLVGRPVAEANPQAGYTRHPVGFADPGLIAALPRAPAILQPLQRLAEPAPPNRDTDCYQLVPITGGQRSPLLEQFVVWDCPDMTTWAADGYASRLVEVAGLADAVVYVASDERYNDIVPTQFLRLLLEAGKPVVVCLTKMRPEQAPTLVQHFQSEVLAHLPPGRVTCLAVPHLPPETLADPAGPAVAAVRIPLLNQVLVLGDPADVARRSAVVAAGRYLHATRDDYLRLVQTDLEALGWWAERVESGRREFDARYSREYLSGERFPRFDEALVRLMELLEIPGVGKAVSGVLWVVRTPYRLFKGLMSKAFAPPAVGPIPEAAVLDAALQAWLDALHAEAVRRAGDSPLWAKVAEDFNGHLAPAIRERYAAGVKSFQAGLAAEVEHTARAIYGDLERSPGTLTALRGGKLALDGAAIVATLAVGHVGLHDLVLVPLAASVSHQLVEWAGAQYVESQRDATRQRQLALEEEHVSGPIRRLLLDWPARHAGHFQRLAAARERLPATIDQIAASLAP